MKTRTGSFAINCGNRVIGNCQFKFGLFSGSLHEVCADLIGVCFWPRPTSKFIGQRLSSGCHMYRIQLTACTAHLSRLNNIFRLFNGQILNRRIGPQHEIRVDFHLGRFISGWGALCPMLPCAGCKGQACGVAIERIRLPRGFKDEDKSTVALVGSCFWNKGAWIDNCGSVVYKIWSTSCQTKLGGPKVTCEWRRPLEGNRVSGIRLYMWV